MFLLSAPAETAHACCGCSARLARIGGNGALWRLEVCTSLSATMGDAAHSQPPAHASSDAEKPRVLPSPSKRRVDGGDSDTEAVVRVHYMPGEGLGHAEQVCQ
jgi:hypothetical protein